MIRVILESPFAAPDAYGVAANLDFARRCMRDCLRRGEAPFAPHLLYTQTEVLDDAIPEERDLGIAASLSWGASADATVAYLDRGMSAGMREGILRAKAEGRRVEMRYLDPSKAEKR